MHELSIVMGIVDIARKEVKKANKQRVETIELDIGAISGVEYEALDFAWAMGVKETVLEGAQRIINKIPAKAKCVSCQHEFEAKTIFDSCPECGEFFTEILSGKELRVKALTVE